MEKNNRFYDALCEHEKTIQQAQQKALSVIKDFVTETLSPNPNKRIYFKRGISSSFFNGRIQGLMLKEGEVCVYDGLNEDSFNMAVERLTIYDIKDILFNLSVENYIVISI